jgi:sn-glycerol 3-phosphate transport system ATP-binding protein
MVIAGANDGGPFRTDVQVMAVELVGAESYVHAIMGDGDAIVFRVPGRSGIQIGEKATLTANPDRFHLFDADGKRV